MIDIYAVHYTDEEGVYHDNETLIQSIPFSDSSEIKIISPSISIKIDSAETMNFKIQPGTPLFNSFYQMRSYIRVVYDDETIFYGRVLTIDTNYFGERTIQCEGAISFLNDTYYPGTKSEDRSEQTLYEYMQDIISRHNSQVTDSYKEFRLGEVPGHYSGEISSEQKIENASRAFGESSWTTSKTVLENLKSYYSGFFMTRYSEGHSYLDWLDHYGRAAINNQEVKIGENVVDLSYVTEVNNIFTAIIPVGKTESSDSSLFIDGYRTDIHGDNNYLRVDAITHFYSDAELNSGYHNAEDYKTSVQRYGMIYKIVEFQEADTQEKLLNMAAKWIKDNYIGSIDEFSVTAVDMHLIGYNNDKIRVGDRVKISYIEGKQNQITRILTCTEIKFDLFNPEKNQYTFGIPSTSLTKNYSVNSKKSSETETPSSSYTPPKVEPPDPMALFIEKARDYLMGHKVWYNSNNKVEGGPYSSNKYNYFMRPAKSGYYYLWKPKTSGSSWAKDANGHPLGAGTDDPQRLGWVSIKKSDFNLEVIQNYKLIQYIMAEYGFNILTDLGVEVPGFENLGDTVTNIWTKVTSVFGPTVAKIGDVLNGKTSLYQLISDGAGDIVSRLKVSWDSGEGLLGFFKNLTGIDVPSIIVDPESGDMIFLDDGQETFTIRNLRITALDTEDKVGWIVEEDEHGDLKFKNPGEMTLSIEEYNNGKLVVSRTAGELTYLGNSQTQYLTSVSLNHMDHVCGDYEYETDPATGIQYVKINTGGGMRVRHGKINPATGEFERDSHGNIIQADFGVYDNNTLTGGIVVQKINEDTTITKIKGDRVDIEAKQVRVGSTTNVENWMNSTDTWKNSTDETLESYEGLIADRATIGQLNAQKARIDDIVADYITSTNLKTSLAKIDILNVKNISAVPIDGSSCTFDSFHADEYYGNKYYVNIPGGGGSVTYNNLTDGVYDIQIVHNSSSNTYTLQKRNIKSTIWEDVGSFSRATTLSGAWSSGTLTVTASPQNERFIRSIVQKTPSWEGNAVTVPIYAQYGSSGQYEEDTGRSIYVDCTGKLENKGTITSNGTYTPSDGYIGISSIKVNVETSDIANAKARFNAASGSYYIEAYDNRYGTAITDSSVTYKLATSGSTSSTKVIITNAGGTQLSSTPELSVGSLYTNGYNTGKSDGVASVTITDVSVYGSPAATATSISVQATASNGATKIGSIGITTQRNNAYNSGGATAKVNQSTQTLGYGGSVKVTAQYVNASGTTVNTNSSCTITAPADNKGTGWTLAVGKVSLPGAGTAASMSVTTPTSTYNTSGATSYTVSADNTYAYIKQGSTVVARASHSAYTNGANSVTITDVSVYGSPAATATSISVQATASNGATKIGSIGITTQRNDAYNSGHNGVSGDDIILSSTAGSGVGTESTSAPSSSVTKTTKAVSGYIWLKETGKSTTTYKNLRTFSLSLAYTRYSSSKVTLYYKSGSSYYQAGSGSYYWYYSNTNYSS